MEIKRYINSIPNDIEFDAEHEKATNQELYSEEEVKDIIKAISNEIATRPNGTNLEECQKFKWSIVDWIDKKWGLK